MLKHKPQLLQHIRAKMTLVNLPPQKIKVGNLQKRVMIMQKPKNQLFKQNKKLLRRVKLLLKLGRSRTQVLNTIQLPQVRCIRRVHHLWPQLRITEISVEQQVEQEFLSILVKA